MLPQDPSHLNLPRPKAVSLIDVAPRETRLWPVAEREERSGPVKLGQGRSAEVFLDRGAGGLAFVRKVFIDRGAAGLLLRLLTGAPNPYTWCEAAIRCAHARRLILRHLVAHWFGDRLRIPRLFGWCRNEEQRTFELFSEFVDGSHLPLARPRTEPESDLFESLVEGVMRPLQRHLAETGFDGLVWQAGSGNPVAASNFMVDQRGSGGGRWVWIDLESGIPPVLALNPLSTLRFYLPRSIHHRRLLFDDVDLPKLRAYLERHRSELLAALEPEAVNEIARGVDELEEQQRIWKSARWSDAPWRDRRLLDSPAAQRLEATIPEGHRPAAGSRTLRLLRTSWRFLSRRRSRPSLLRQILRRRIDSWRRRRFLDSADAGRLHDLLDRPALEPWLAATSGHLALQAWTKPIQCLAVPALFASGAISPGEAFLAAALLGPLARSAYTAGSLVLGRSRGLGRPWIAFGIGLVPVVGSFAYPLQHLRVSDQDTQPLARFVLCDLLATLGRALPIWGGEDSLIEHRANRLAGRVTSLVEKVR